MKKDKKQSDNWSSLLSDLGLEQEKQEQPEDVDVAETVETVYVEKDEPAPATPTVVAPTVAPPTVAPAVTASDGFGAGLLDEPVAETPVPDGLVDETAEEAETEGPEKGRSGKKSFFDRFPKMNLFGAPPKESLESVAEVAKKSPSLGGKTFTSGTLEKAPHVQGRDKRKKEEPTTDEKKSPVKKDVVTDEVETTKPEGDSNPWSQIAAQVGVLSTPTEPAAKPEPRPEPRRESAGRKDRNHGPDRKGGRKNPPSMFDTPATEPEETKTLKNLMEDRDSLDGEAEKRLHSMFGEPGESKPEAKAAEPTREDRPKRGRRGSRFEENKSQEDDFAEELFDRFHEKEEESKPAPKTRQEDRREDGRGRRGSRYVEQDTGKESERNAGRDADSRDGSRDGDEAVERAPRRGARTQREPAEPVRRREEPAWDLDEEPRQESRGRGRGSRSEKPEERSGKENARERSGGRESREPAPAVPAQKSVPSWDDAIGVIVSANVARHNQRPRKNGGRR